MEPCQKRSNPLHRTPSSAVAELGIETLPKSGVWGENVGGGNRVRIPVDRAVVADYGPRNLCTGEGA